MGPGDEDTTGKAVVFTALEGARGWAAMQVAAGHALVFFSRNQDDRDRGRGQDQEHKVMPWRPLVYFEFLSPVTFFFLVSGFALAHAYPSGAGDGANFWAKRAARLAPMYYVSLALAIAPMCAFAPSWWTGTEEMLASALWAQSFTGVLGFHSNVSLWSCSSLLVCYALFPLLQARMSTWDSFKLVLAAGGMWLASLGGIGLWLAWVLPTVSAQGHVFFAFRVPQFAMGMSAYHLRAATHRRATEWRFCLCGATEAISVALLGNALVLFFLLTDCLNAGEYVVYMFATEFLLAPPLMCAWLVGTTSPTGGPTSWFLSSRGMQFLGRISYSVFCMHYPLLLWCALVIRPHDAPERIELSPAVTIPVWPTFTLREIAFGFLPGLVLLSWAVHVAIEKPARRWLTKRLGEK